MSSENKNKEPLRWYVCTESKPAFWTCEESVIQPTLEPAPAPTKIAISVSAGYPKWWDAIYISNSLRPQIVFKHLNALEK
jgi:hypothetical protein